MKHHYLQSVILGVMATLVVSISSAHFKNSNPVLMYINSVINERYVYSYFTLLFGFSSIFFGALALKYQDSRRRLSVLLFTLSASPLIWGCISWQMELFEANSVYNGQMSFNPSKEQVADIKWMHIMAKQYAFDSMVLALFVTMIAISISLMHWVMCGGVEKAYIATTSTPRLSIFFPWLLYYIIAGVLITVASIFTNLIISVIAKALGYSTGALLLFIRIVAVFIVGIIISYPVYKIIFERIIYSRMLLKLKRHEY